MNSNLLLLVLGCWTLVVALRTRAFVRQPA